MKQKIINVEQSEYWNEKSGPKWVKNEDALKLISKAIKKAGFVNGKDVSICLDVAANELFKNNKYAIDSKKYISYKNTILFYSKIIKRYKIKSIEDPFAENDWKSWSDLHKKEKIELPTSKTTRGMTKKMARGGRAENPISRTTTKGGNYRPTKSGAGMTKKGVAAYRRANPGSKLKTAVTGKVKPGSKAANRRKSYCARSAGQMKKFPKAAKDPNSRLRQARRRWKC